MVHIATKHSTATLLQDAKKITDKLVGFRGKITDLNKEVSKQLGNDISLSKGNTGVVLDNFLVGTSEKDEDYVDFTVYYILDNNKDYYITEVTVAT